MRIHVVVPITTPGLSHPEHFQEHAGQGTVIELSQIATGPASIESSFDEAMALPGILTRVAQAEAGGAEAIIIDCMGDPALGAAREIAAVPVVGPAQAAMHATSLLAANFAILTTGETVVGMFHDLVLRYGMADRVTSLRTVGISAVELGDDARVADSLFAQAEQAHDEGAHAILFGCTGMRGWARRIEDHLAGTGRTRIPVVDPVAIAVRTAETLAALRLLPSKRSYPTPPEKAITGYPELVDSRRG